MIQQIFIDTLHQLFAMSLYFDQLQVNKLVTGRFISQLLYVPVFLHEVQVLTKDNINVFPKLCAEFGSNQQLQDAFIVNDFEGFFDFLEKEDDAQFFNQNVFTKAENSFINRHEDMSIVVLLWILSHVMNIVHYFDFTFV